MEKPSQINRACSSCGIQKPLSAFLQLEGTQGASYGNVCASCRGKEVKTESSDKGDDKSKLELKLRIGSAEKMYADKQQRIQKQTEIEDYQEEVKKKEELKTKKTFISEIKEKAEKEHHKGYLEGKKQAYLDKTKSFLSKTEKAFRPLTEAERAREIRKLEAIFQQHQRLTTADLQQSPLFHEARYQSSVLQQMIIRFLGPSSPLGMYLATIGGSNPSMFVQPTAHPVEPKKDILDDYIDKTMGPSSKRGR